MSAIVESDCIIGAAVGWVIGTGIALLVMQRWVIPRWVKRALK